MSVLYVVHLCVIFTMKLPIRLLTNVIGSTHMSLISHRVHTWIKSLYWRCHKDTCKTIFNGLIGLLPNQAMFLALPNVLDLIDLLPKEKKLNDECIDRKDLKSGTYGQPVAKHILSNPFQFLSKTLGIKQLWCQKFTRQNFNTVRFPIMKVKPTN